ncbi:O-succinylbenzoic acid--CoA ligase [Kineococcus xinjiangensis]|uniref:O-succinylbenzoic acid--CoA ligase n=1 Tax=Kineococcus xinjiangensis TaxID=512762 RepID=A0A2S6IT92_9ACTN|nr:o-succinylbenzoate--CoA ligase [Kineococcus xinjiangensis]PPK97472.1 O-succinylbenzoic acid--CoA ligase [Kineococcus xinjiangensis]
MSAARLLQPLPLPTGAAVLAALPRLRAALDGTGPALLPHPAGSPPPADLLPGEPLAAAEDDPDDPTAVVVSTSGSTGTAKGALLSAAALRASATATRTRLGAPGPPGGEQWLLALPAHHVAGLQVLLRSLLAGTEPVVVDLAGGFTPAAFTAAAAACTGALRRTSLVPTQLLRLLDAGAEATAALASFDAVLVGAAATPPALLERAAAAGVRVVTTYGSSETCGGCVYDGLPLDGVHADVEPATSRVLLSGDVVARGYRARPDAPAFDRDPAGRRRFRTDDAGVLRAGPGGSGQRPRLEVLGRLDDLVTTGGLKVAPALVEGVLVQHPAVAEAAVVGVEDERWGQRLVAAVVAREAAGGVDLAQLRAFVTARLAAHAAPRQLVLLRELPLRGPGKPDRLLLQRLARESAVAPERADG